MRPGLRFFCGCSAALLFCPGDIAARRLKLRRKRLRRVITPTLCFSRNPDKKELIMRTKEEYYELVLENRALTADPVSLPQHSV